ncbi:PEPxxWA-CTERM sorting domain-containing protein [Thermaurantiacus sp.]
MNIIDFEDAGLFGGDNALVTSTYGNDRGVRFVGQQGIQLFFERRGSSPTVGDVDYATAPTGVLPQTPQGFVRDFPTSTPGVPNAKLWDTERPGFSGTGLGQFFMTSTGSPGHGSTPAGFDKTKPFFSIEYLRAPAKMVGGQIWDIDGTGTNASEGWEVKAFSATDTLLFSAASPIISTNGASSLDGLPWAFLFDGPNVNQIARLDFFFTGTKTTGIGVAFDNFQSGVVPEPRTWAMLIAGFGLVGASLRRRRGRVGVTTA